MAEYAQEEAARNVTLKERYPLVDDPKKAIAFALHLGDIECFDFLLTWNEGYWADIEMDYPEYLSGLDKGWNSPNSEDL